MRSSFTLKTTLTAPLVDKATGVKRRRARVVIPPYVLAASLGFLTISLSGSVLLDAELKGLYHFIVCYLTLPVVAGCYGVAWLGMRGWREQVSILRAVCAPGLIAMAILFTCSGVVNYANALLGSGTPLRYSGPITKRSYTSGRSGRAYYVVMVDAATSRTCEFRVTQREYAHLKVGDAYARTMQQGGLGYAYRWRH